MMSTSGAPDPGIAVIVMTDGRDEYLQPCLLSAGFNLTGPIVEWWMHDDTGDDSVRDELRQRYPTFRHVGEGPRRGFGGAIRHVWDTLRVSSTAAYVFHLECDFTFRRGVDLAAMAAVLDAQPHLAQLSLRRQPWSREEHAAGGVIERFPDAYVQRENPAGSAWLEHRLYWTTNPSLYRSSLLSAEWPPGDESEGRFGLQLLQAGTPETSPGDVRFGVWGRRGDGPHVDHIGHARVGAGY